jgi:hypothetical protein
MNENPVETTVEQLMRPEDLARGVTEIRAGISPNFDNPEIADSWAYERGRQWALLAPRSMALYRRDRPNRINPAAIALFDRAYQRGEITNEHYADE